MDNFFHVGQQDQMFAAIIEMAVALRKYHEECVSRGFTEDQAFRLTLELQRSMMGGANR